MLFIIFSGQWLDNHKSRSCLSRENKMCSWYLSQTLQCSKERKGSQGACIVVLRYWRSHFCHLSFLWATMGTKSAGQHVTAQLKILSCTISNCFLHKPHIPGRLPCNPKTRVMRQDLVRHYTVPLLSPLKAHSMVFRVSWLRDWLTQYMDEFSWWDTGENYFDPLCWREIRILWSHNVSDILDTKWVTFLSSPLHPIISKFCLNFYQELQRNKSPKISQR